MNSTGAMPKKINMSHFGLNLGKTAEDSEMFTNNWLSSKGINWGQFINGVNFVQLTFLTLQNTIRTS